MASSVFYKFKSQKDESRVTFDGTAISVFDLKKEIILANNLGKANDFDLYIYDASTNRLLNAYVEKQYPNAMNVKSTFGSLGAAKTGIRKGAEALVAQLDSRL